MRKLFLIITAVILSHSGFSQQDPNYSQYTFNQLMFNPAYAGTGELGNITAIYRQQWVGMDEAPNTQLIAADVPFEEKHMGLGVVLGRDALGINTKNWLQLSYAYHLRVSQKGILSLGLSGEINYYNADVSKVNVPDDGDPIYNNGNYQAWSPNVGTGLYYYTDKLFAGISVPHLINYRPNTFLSLPGLQDEWQRERHYFAHLGYLFSLSENLKFRPSVLGKYVADAPMNWDLNANFLLYDRVWLGAAYRTGGTMVGLVQFHFTPRFKFGYSYDYTLSELQNFNSGSHEIMLSYDFGDRDPAMKTPRYF